MVELTNRDEVSMNTWVTFERTSRDWMTRGKQINRRTRSWRRRLASFLAVVGPGLITSNVDNDAGGITIYTTAGAQFGYTLLWSLIPMTIALYVTEEMCARMGVVTGKGLSDLIREEFGFRSTFFVMIAALAVDLGNTVAEFAGVAASMQIFAISKYIAVPIAAIAVWLWSSKAPTDSVEKIFLGRLRLLSCLTFFPLCSPSPIGSGRQGNRHAYIPFQRGISADADGADRHHDRSVAILLSAGRFRRKESRPAPVQARPPRRSRRQHLLHGHRVLHHRLLRGHAASHGLTKISDAAKPPTPSYRWQGSGQAGLFAFGLLNASLFAASILALSTAHVICEGLGFEAGLDRKFKEAPAFYSLYTGLIVVGAGIILIPKAPLLKILVLSQVANGVWLPGSADFHPATHQPPRPDGRLRKHARASTSSPGP